MSVWLMAAGSVGLMTLFAGYLVSAGAFAWRWWRVAAWPVRWPVILDAVAIALFLGLEVYWIELYGVWRVPDWITAAYVAAEVIWVCASLAHLDSYRTALGAVTALDREIAGLRTRVDAGRCPQCPYTLAPPRAKQRRAP